VSSWERFGDSIATLAFASFTWISGVVAPGVFVGSPTAVVDLPVENQLSSVMHWAQQEDGPAVEQVGEDTDGDIETLDDVPASVDEADATEDVELLDEAPSAKDQQDVELLDQGSSTATTSDSPAPATTSESPAPTTVSPAPVTTYMAPAAPSVPIPPEGFGTGDVYAATGSAGFPVGLEDCHVGAVTGRAYVGVDCGDSGGSSFVGHAPSFEEFPFVLDENFPFDGESVFAVLGHELFGDNYLENLVTAAGDDKADAPEAQVAGRSSVEFERRAHDRKPRVETAHGRSKRGNEKRGSGNTNAAVSESQGPVDSTSAQSAQQKKNRGKDRVRAGANLDEKKSKDSNNMKKHDGKKVKKRRASK
jgi:hypothetical protein